MDHSRFSSREPRSRHCGRRAIPKAPGQDRWDDRRAKWRLVRNLYEAGYNADQVRELFRLIDWMMHLRADLSERFEEELIALEDSRKMPYITSVERIAEARGEAMGEARGVTRGGASVLLRQLGKLWGSLPGGVEERIRKLTLERLQALGEAVLEFKSLQDLESWLDSNEKPEAGEPE